MDERFKPHWTDIIGWPVGTVDSHPHLMSGVIKTTIVALDDAERDAALPAVAALGLRVGVATSPLTPGWSYLNITRMDADKGVALQAAAAALDLELSQVAVVGDGGNDVAMLALAGTAIAMGDAPTSLLRHAHFVVGDVEADGAAEALRGVVAANRA